MKRTSKPTATRRQERFRPEPTSNTLLLLIRDHIGSLRYAAIGSALLDADWGADLSMLPTGEDTLCFGELMCDSPAQAKHAYEELASLGDVPVRPSDFAPTWHRIGEGIKAIDGLLSIRDKLPKARRLITTTVADELFLAKRILIAHDRPGSHFYFVEVQEDEDRDFAGQRLVVK